MWNFLPTPTQPEVEKEQQLQDLPHHNKTEPQQKQDWITELQPDPNTPQGLQWADMIQDMPPQKAPKQEKHDFLWCDLVSLVCIANHFYVYNFGYFSTVAVCDVFKRRGLAKSWQNNA